MSARRPRRGFSVLGADLVGDCSGEGRGSRQFFLPPSQITAERRLLLPVKECCKVYRANKEITPPPQKNPDEVHVLKNLEASPPPTLDLYKPIC